MFEIQKPALTIDRHGLMLRACKLAKWNGDTLQANPAAMAILAQLEQAARIEKAIATWNRGEQTLALIMLVHLGEPAIKTEAQVRAELAKAGFDPDQPRDEDGKWTDEGDGTGSDAAPQPRISIAQTSPDTSGPEITIHPNPPASSLSDAGSAVLHGLNEAFGVPSAEAQEDEPAEETAPEDENRLLPGEQPSLEQLARMSAYKDAFNILQRIDPDNPQLQSLTAPGYVPTQENIDALWDASREALGIPEDWIVKVTNRGGGREYINPANIYDRVRIMPGNPTGSLRARLNPYVIDQFKSQFLRTDGTRQSDSSAEEVHIPLEEYDFRR